MRLRHMYARPRPYKISMLASPRDLPPAFSYCHGRCRCFAHSSSLDAGSQTRLDCCPNKTGPRHRRACFVRVDWSLGHAHASVVGCLCMCVSLHTGGPEFFKHGQQPKHTAKARKLLLCVPPTHMPGRSPCSHMSLSTHTLPYTQAIK